MRQRQIDSILKVEYKGKEIETDTLYRYIIDLNTGNFKVTEKKIKQCGSKNGWSNRIIFTDNSSIDPVNLMTVFSGKTLYIPVDDPSYVIETFNKYFNDSVISYKEKIDKLNRLITKLDTAKLNLSKSNVEKDV